MEIQKGNANEEVFTSLLVTRGQMNAITTNATTMITMMSMKITTSNANANAANKKKDNSCENRNGQELIPRNGLPTRTQNG